MRRLTTFIAVIFAAAAFAPLRAQSLDAFKERLAAPVVSDAAFGTARVTVTEYGDAEKAVDDASRVGQRLRLRVTGSVSSSTTGRMPAPGPLPRKPFSRRPIPESWYTRCTRIPISRSWWETA